MKTSQWVGALVVLAAMVFGITLVRNYLGPTAPQTTQPTPVPDGGEELPRLKFGVMRFPVEGNYQEVEYRKPGHHDFAFRNDTGGDVRVGVAGKNCKCSGLELFYLSPEDAARPQATLDAVRAVTGGAAGGPGAAFAQLLHAPPNASLPWAESAARSVTLVPDARDGVAVPAGAVGWVRMTWTGEKSGPQLLRADLWMSDPALRQPLEFAGLFIDPLRVSTEDFDGQYTVRQLPVRMTSRICWSTVRPRFELRAEVVRPAGVGPDADPFVVDELRPLTEEELAVLRRTGPALAGYRLTVTLHPVAPDGKTPCELGTSRREVRLVPDGGMDPVAVPFTFAVQGDVSVGGVEDAGRVRFGSFDRTTRRTRTITLRSSVPGLGLEMDRSRVPDYLEAELVGPEKDPLGTSWELKVTVLAGRASGRFPRDDPSYRDSAIYLRTTGPTSQAVRVPVEGNAAERR
jgi:hypothetical protein